MQRSVHAGGTTTLHVSVDTTGYHHVVPQVLTQHAVYSASTVCVVYTLPSRVCSTGVECYSTTTWHSRQRMHPPLRACIADRMAYHTSWVVRVAVATYAAYRHAAMHTYSTAVQHTAGAAYSVCTQ